MTPGSPYSQRWAALKQDRSTWVPHWKELSEYFLPRNGRFFDDQTNRGEKRHNSIYDNTGTRALRILGAGLMSGMTSPARPWFRLGIPDEGLASDESVKEWLELVTERMRRVFELSNTYRALHQMYEQLGLYGTAAAFVLDDYDDVLRFYNLAPGEYAIACDPRGVVNTLYREYPMTTVQLVEEFGLDNVSTVVRQQFQSGQGLDTPRNVLHVVEPRAVRDPRDPRAKSMPWASLYFERGTGSGMSSGDHLLRESGFKRFRALAPRWALEAGDTYGMSPGMEALGDVKQLQHSQLRKSQGIDYQTNPPLQVPSGTKAHDLDALPGGVSYVAMAGAGSGIRNAFEVNVDLSHLLEDIRDIRGRVNGTFFADLFLMLAQDDRSNVTAREIVERHEEKMLMLGPVLERLHDEMLRPLIDIAFDSMVAANMLPPPPEELQGRALTVEFVSVLAQAQRAIGVQSMDRLLGTVGQLAAAKADPSVWDTVDTDRTIQKYGDMLGVDPHLIRGEDELSAVREQRARQQAAAQAAASIQPAAAAMKDLASAQATAPDLMQQLTGYGTS